MIIFVDFRFFFRGHHFSCFVRNAWNHSTSLPPRDQVDSSLAAQSTGAVWASAQFVLGAKTIAFFFPKNENLKYVWLLVFDKRIFPPGRNTRRSLLLKRGILRKIEKSNKNKESTPKMTKMKNIGKNRKIQNWSKHYMRDSPCRMISFSAFDKFIWPKHDFRKVEN